MSEGESVGEKCWFREFLLLGQYPQTLRPFAWDITYSRGLVDVWWENRKWNTNKSFPMGLSFVGFPKTRSTLNSGFHGKFQRSQTNLECLLRWEDKGLRQKTTEEFSISGLGGHREHLDMWSLFRGAHSIDVRSCVQAACFQNIGGGTVRTVSQRP